MERGNCTNGGNSKNRIARHKKLVLLASASSAVAMLSHAASAATETWVGNTSINWNAANWTGTNVPPVSNDALIFNAAGTSGVNLNNDLTSTAFNISSITFGSTAPSYNISGNAFTLTGGISNSGGAQTINDAINLVGDQGFSTTTAAGTLTFNGNITGTGVNLTTNGGAAGAKVASNTIFTGVVSLGSVVVQGNAGNGQVFSSNPTTTFNNATLTTTGGVTVGRSNLVFTGNTVANITGAISLPATAGNQDWARATIQGNAKVTCTSFNISNGVTGGFNLSGGVLTTGSIYGIESSDGTYTNHNYLNGTQLVATQNNAAFLTITKSAAFAGGSNAYVGNGGAIFNSSGFNIGTSTAFLDDTASTGNLTKLGAGSLTLSGLSGISGTINVNSGTLVANVANTALTNTVTAPNTSALGAPNTAHNLNVNNGGTLNFNVSNVLGSNSNIFIAERLIVNAGGLVNNSVGTSNTLGPVSLNGGTIAAVSGINATSQAFYFRQGVTVGGTSASTLSSTGANSGFNLVSTGTNFNVGVTGASGGDLLVTGTLADTATGAAGMLVKSGPGTMVLSGVNTYTGTTNVSAGTLSIASTGSIPTTSSVLLSGTSNLTAANPLTLSALTLQDGAINTASVTAGLNLSGSTLGFDVGNTGSTGKVDLLNLTGSISGASANTINIKLLPGQSLINGNYTIINAPGGGLSGATFVLGSVPAGFSTFSLANSTSSTEILSVISKPTIVGNAYWTGVASTTGSDTNNNWGFGGSLSPQHSNWSNQSTGTVDALTIPGGTSDVIFTASNVTGTGALNTQLDSSYTIQGLSIASSTVTSVGINTNGSLLTIGTDGLNVTSASTAGLAITGTGSVVLSGSQTWANNNNAQSMNVSTGVSALSGAVTLNLAGTGTGGVILGGPIGDGGGNLALVLNQAGTTYINGSNTFTGGVTLNSGTVVLGNNGAFNATAPNAVTFGAASTADLQLSGHNVAVSALNTNATLGSPIIENASSTAATLTANTSSGTSTYGGTVQDGSGGGALSLSTTGAGGLVLSGPVSYTGSTTVAAGSKLTLSGTVSTTGNTTVAAGGSLVLAGNSTAGGSLSLGNNSTLTLVANSGNTVSGASNAIGNPSAVNYANNLNTTNVQLRGDTDVTFTNASPTGGTGGFPNFSILNFDANNLGGSSTATNHTLSLGNTTAGTAGFGTFNTFINATGGNGYTVGIPAITNANNTFLNLNASSANLTIPGGITNVATLTVNGASNTSLGSITGAGPVVKTGTGTLTLGSSNGYTGNTNISAGTLAIGASGSISSAGIISIGSGAKLDITANPSFTLATNATLAGTGLINGPYAHSVGFLSPGGTGVIGTLSDNGGLTLSGGTVNLDLSGSNNSTGGIYNDLISVTGGLTLTGTTPFSVAVPPSINVPSGTIYTVLTYTGALNSSGGSINLGSSLYTLVPLASTPGKVQIQYSTGLVQNLVWTGANNSNWDVATTANWISSGNSALFNNADKVTFDDSSTVATTSVNLVTNVAPGSVTVNSNANNFTFSGSGSITGNTGLVKMGTSTLTIANSNSYTGDTNVSGGSIILTGTTGSDLGTGNLLIGANASVQIQAGNGANANTTLVNASIVNSGSLIFNSSSPVGMNVPISGSGSVVQQGPGIVGFNVANSYTGGTTVSGSTAFASDNAAFGTGPVTINGGQVFSFGSNYPNAFNLSSPSSVAAIHGGGGAISTVSGPVTLIGDTILQIDGNASIAFVNTPTALTGTTSNLVVNGDNNSTFAVGGSVNLGTGTISVGPNTALKLQPLAAATITIPTAIIAAGSVLHSGPGTTVLSGSNTYSGGTNVTGGKLVLASSTALPSGNALTVGAAGTLQIAASTGNSSYLVTTGSLTNTGLVDVVNNAMVVQNASANIGTLTAQVAAGYNGGAWNGNSASGVITSSAAAANAAHLTAVGIVTGLNTFAAQGGMVSVGSQDVLIKYTYYGDANLDGHVDGSDYSLIDSAYLGEGFVNGVATTPASGWYNGDFNYDGVVNGSDYTLMDNAYNTQGAAIAASIATPTAQLAGVGSSSVPEPASMTLVSVLAAGLLGRRRRR